MMSEKIHILTNMIPSSKRLNTGLTRPITIFLEDEDTSRTSKSKNKNKTARFSGVMSSVGLPTNGMTCCCYPTSSARSQGASALGPHRGCTHAGDRSREQQLGPHRGCIFQCQCLATGARVPGDISRDVPHQWLGHYSKYCTPGKSGTHFNLADLAVWSKRAILLLPKTRDYL